MFLYHIPKRSAPLGNDPALIHATQRQLRRLEGRFQCTEAHAMGRSRNELLGVLRRRTRYADFQDLGLRAERHGLAAAFETAQRRLRTNRPHRLGPRLMLIDTVLAFGRF